MTAAVSECPRCRSRVQWNAAFPYRPFCSERCKLIDLGAWLDESHRIPGHEADSPTAETGRHEDG